MIRKTVHYTGHVQGVGFRYTATTIASRHRVAGYVQNLPDGSVRLIAEGDKADVDAFLDEVASAMRGHIEQTQVDENEATAEFGRPADDDAFVVKY